MNTRGLLGLVLAWVGLIASPSAARPMFIDRTLDAGLTETQHTPVSYPGCIFVVCEVERMSGGAAVADIDGDGDLDLFMTTLYKNNILWLNDGDGTFSNATVARGLGGFPIHANGAAFGDIDNDGDPDLYLTVLGPAGSPPHNRFYLFVNDGTGTFTESAVSRGCAVQTSGSHRGFSVAFGDYDRDGWVDIHTTEWNGGLPANARLLRNLGGALPGHFSDVTAAAGVSYDLAHSFASAMTDLDGDGWPDLAVAADFGTSRLYWNNGNGTFTNGTEHASVGTDENGMGSTFGDYDADGDLDWFVTSIYDPDESCPSCNWGTTGNRLYRNDGNRGFTDVTDQAGVRDGGWGWGTAFFDYDNDRDLDLVMTNGVDFPDTTSEALFNADQVRLWENDGTGLMTEVATSVGLTDTESGKGLLVFDYDADGDLDLFIVNNGQLPKLYRNDGGNLNGWVRVRAVGSTSNREGLGARVLLDEAPGLPTQIREVGTSSHFLGQSERIVHFGVGQGSAPIDLVTLRWPSGKLQGFAGVQRNSTLIADESDCADSDADSRCGALDCDDFDPETYRGAVELNDGVDNQCPGEAGFGAADEIAFAGFSNASDRDEFSWQAQLGATQYEVIRSAAPTFPAPCAGSTSASTSWVDPAVPAPGALFVYLVRPAAPFPGSWGLGTGGTERLGLCQ